MNPTIYGLLSLEYLVLINASFQNEYQKYIAFTKSANLPIMNQEEAKIRKLALRQRKESSLSNQDVEFSLQEKKKLGIAVRNYALEKNILLEEREIAAADKNKEEMTRIDETLQKLETEMSFRKKNTRLEELTRLNQRNRQRNFLTLQQTVKSENSKGKLSLLYHRG
jgi:ribosome-associated translation inhibitor RaiA